MEAVSKVMKYVIKTKSASISLESTEFKIEPYRKRLYKVAFVHAYRCV
jgi:hypothetical protein